MISKESFGLTVNSFDGVVVFGDHGMIKVDEKWIPIVGKKSPSSPKIFVGMPPPGSGLGDFGLTVSFLLEEMAVGHLPLNQFSFPLGGFFFGFDLS